MRIRTTVDGNRLSEWLGTGVLTREFWQPIRVQKKAVFSQYVELWEEKS